MIYLNLAAPNDSGGNPQRIYVVFDDHGDIVQTLDVGYTNADRTIRKQWPGIHYAGQFDTTVKQYKSLQGFKKRIESEDPVTFRYRGLIYVRPIGLGRGIVLMGTNGNPQLEDLLESGDYEAEIVIRPRTK